VVSSPPPVHRPPGSWWRLVLWVTLLAVPAGALLLADSGSGAALDEAARTVGGVAIVLGGPIVAALAAVEAYDLVLDQLERRAARLRRSRHGPAEPDAPA
jgi:hypothetical protein